MNAPPPTPDSLFVPRLLAEGGYPAVATAIARAISPDRDAAMVVDAASLEWLAVHAPWLLTELREALESGALCGLADVAVPASLIGAESAARRGRYFGAAVERWLHAPASELDDGSAEGAATVAIERAGKNADHLARLVRRAEFSARVAETVVALTQVDGDRSEVDRLGDPTWSLINGWRELFAAQHPEHLVAENTIGAEAHQRLEHSLAITHHVATRHIDRLARRVGRDGIVINPFGWPLEISGFDEDTGRTLVLGPVPPFGYLAASEAETVRVLPEIELFEDGNELTLARGEAQIVVDAAAGVVRQFISRAAPRGILDPSRPLLELSMNIDGRDTRLERAEIEVHEEEGTVTIRRFGKKTGFVIVTLGFSPTLDALDLSIDVTGLKPPSPGSRLTLAISPNFDLTEVTHDGTPETGLAPSALDLSSGNDNEPRLAIYHDGSGGWERTERGVAITLLATDPRDPGAEIEPALPPRLRLHPHHEPARLPHLQAAQEFLDPSDAALPFVEVALVERALPTPHRRPDDPAPDRPAADGLVEWDGDDSVLITSLHAAALESGAASEETSTIVRLFEVEGEPAGGQLIVRGSYTQAHHHQRKLELQPTAPPTWAPPASVWTAIPMTLGPHEVATIQLNATPTHE